MENNYRYHVGDTTYIQRPLVIGQVKQLTDVLKDIVLPSEVDITEIIGALGDSLPAAFAVILTPEGTHPKDKDIAALAIDIAFGMDMETAMQAVDDFFGLNPIVSVLGRLNGMIETMRESMTGQKNSSVSSRGETSQSGMQSSGDTQSESAGPISNTEGGT